MSKSIDTVSKYFTYYGCIGFIYCVNHTKSNTINIVFDALGARWPSGLERWTGDRTVRGFESHCGKLFASEL